MKRSQAVQTNGFLLEVDMRHVHEVQKTSGFGRNMAEFEKMLLLKTSPKLLDILNGQYSSLHWARGLSIMPVTRTSKSQPIKVAILENDVEESTSGHPNDPMPTSSKGHLPALLESPQKAKKLKLLAAYGLSSPYPDLLRPTKNDCSAVFDLLCQAHPECHSTRRAPKDTSNSAQTCGGVPDVIDSLVGTILSQNTSNKNSSTAKSSLDRTFGVRDWDAVASAPHDAVADALRSGGLADKKATVIQKLLHEIKKRHGCYSLQHLASASNEEAMNELQSYDGVGPKTASCVLLFCLGRESFAVDTHVYRLTRLLGWVPPKADRVMAQAHLDVRVPGELKYGLHVLLIYHGRRCAGCKNASSGKTCILKDWRNTNGSKRDDIENPPDEKVGEITEH